MKPILKILIPLLFIAGTLMMQSCATIFGGKSNTLVFKADTASRAEVFLDGELIGYAPGKIKLTKGRIQHGSKLEIKAEGLEDQEYTIIRKVHPWYTVADFLVGGIWLAIDYGTGNILRPQPRSFNYSIEEPVKSEN
jgi:hypothetical protein